MTGSAVPRYNGNTEGESPPTAAASADDTFGVGHTPPSGLGGKYGQWLIDPPGNTDGTFAYVTGTYEDVVRMVANRYHPHTRIIYAPEVSPLPERPPTEAATMQRAVNDRAFTDAASFCAEAARLVGGDRAATHGDKRVSFQNTADLWNGYMQAKLRTTGACFTAHDVGCMLELFKIARRFTGTYNPDDYVDAAGYAGCAGELAAQEYTRTCPATTPTTAAVNAGPNVAEHSPPATKP